MKEKTIFKDIILKKLYKKFKKVVFRKEYIYIYIEKY